MQYCEIPIRILIADDHELLRAGIIDALKHYPFLHVIAEAANGEELVTLTGLHDPDIVITDIQMPVMNGIEATRMITNQYPRTAVIGISNYDYDYLLADMLHAGARGFVSKQVHPLELVEAIKAVNSGHEYYCEYFLGKFKRLVSLKLIDPVTRELKQLLTSRETEILILICQQQTNKAISARLGISKRTVEEHRSNLLRKTQSNGTADLIFFAIKKGIFIP